MDLYGAGDAGCEEAQHQSVEVDGTCWTALLGEVGALQIEAGDAAVQCTPAAVGPGARKLCCVPKPEQ
ncbi:MAG: hypothetical protein HY744_16240 [Deltaproteobacteria bacterium]|nr:hypothetical protein [Deltaproteobacteria bacterium]